MSTNRLISLMPTLRSAPTPEVAELPAATPACDDPELLDKYTQWFEQPNGSRKGLSQLQLSGMYCAACAGIIERALLQEPGVLEAQVSAASERLQVSWDPAKTVISRLVLCIERIGYGAAPDAAAPARTLREREHRQAVWRLFVAWFLMMQVMMLATPIYWASAGDMAPDLRQLLQWGAWVLSLPVMLFSAGPFFKAAWLQVRERQLGMDVPVSLGLLVTFVASTGATFEPGGVFGHEVYFDSLTMFVSFLLTGRYLELRSRHKVAASLEQATSVLPDRVERLQGDGSSQWVTPGRLQAGDRIRVHAGQAFAADGVIEQGCSEADEALLNGEALPVLKNPGDEVVAGSLNLHAPLIVKVLRVGADTRYEGIVRLMRSALTQRPREARLADRVAGPFLWGVLILAALAGLVWSQLQPDRALWVVVSVLIVTCPCALSLAAPAAWLSAAGALARRGLLLARLDLLETLARVDTVVLDKTGTLTEERMAVQAWQLAPADEPRRAELILQAAALARQSAHPFSRALAAHAPAQDGGVSIWHAVTEYPGKGLEARDAADQVWRLGSPDWVGGPLATGPLDGAQLVFGQLGVPRLWMRIDEVLRADARLAIEQFHRQGLRTLLLSGDAPERVQRLADQAGIQVTVGGASPTEKLAAVKRLQAEGRCVLMVGDGINDAPVLAQADASIAMGHGAMLARVEADALMLTGRLTEIAGARELALRTRRVIRQNLSWAVVYNVACVPAALLGYLPPWLAGLGMAASSLAVVMNAASLGRTVRRS